jgi:hypothetical protein
MTLLDRPAERIEGTAAPSADPARKAAPNAAPVTSGSNEDLDDLPF